MKVAKTVLLDTNIVLRFFREDQPQHLRYARELFRQAEKGIVSCYMDPVILAEVVWTLSSFYKVSRLEIAQKLELLLAQKWMVNEQKQALLSAIHHYQTTNLDYIDCWLLAVSKEKHIPIETFDKKLQKSFNV